MADPPGPTGPDGPDPAAPDDGARTIDVPYLIVGAGPVGLLAARLLAARGSRCLVVERRDGPQTHPAAHVVNARTLEILRQAGVDMARVDAIAHDPARSGHVNYVTRLGGRLIGRLPFERQGPETLDLTPTPLRNISQHHLEPILVDTVRSTDGADLRYGFEWESCSLPATDEAPVVSTVRDASSGERVTVRSRYLLAADGAGSRVRRTTGIEMIGPASLQRFIAVHLIADLRPLVAERPGVLHFVMDPEARGTFVSHGADREWVFMTPFDPAVETEADYTPERCVDLVRNALGRPDPGHPTPEITILGVGAWNMSAQIASGMRDGRIFLVGDAAHRFPPTGGLGLNTGAADAHGLVWKLEAVERGMAGAELLDSYDRERRPVAVHNCDQSTKNAFKVVSLLQALGLDGGPSTAETVHAALDDPANRETIAAAVADQSTHFDMIGLQLGYVYRHGALVRDGDPPEPVENPSVFEPVAVVGGRLPHGWLDDGRSTLDLVVGDGFTLFAFGDHDEWVLRADVATGALDVPIAVVAVGDHAVVPGWAETCGMVDGGALLVRPDQHIAWRAETIGRAADLVSVVRSVLCR